MIKAIVTDIEGTTSSLSFVKDVLFPYARRHMAEFVRDHAEDPKVVAHLKAIRLEVNPKLDLQGIINQLLQWIEEDKKITPLKALQGMIWEAGYKNGDFKGHVYADSEQHLKAWCAKGIKLYVYSSGSVYAQKLLFGYTEYGDLNPLFSGYFDTQIGAKVDAESYQKIVKELALPADHVLFLSDIQLELDAAAAAGMQTRWLVREGDFDNHARHKQVRDFNGIDLSAV